MGCKVSLLKSSGNGTSNGPEWVFGSGVHVGRSGNVDLTGRKMDVLGPKMVTMINEDELHRTASSLTLTDNKLYTLGKEMSLLPKLEGIDMDSNQFQRLPEVLSKLERLSYLNVSSNPLNGSTGFEVLPKMFALRVLVLRDCKLSQVPSRIFECATIEVLDLSNNPVLRLNGVDFNKLPALHSLSVANCGQSGSLPAGIKSLVGLISLDISRNEWNFDDTNFFSASISRTLQELHVCHLGLSAAPPVVVGLKRLSYLDLAENPIKTLDVLAGRIVKRLTRAGNGVPASIGANSNGSGVGQPAGEKGSCPNDGDDVASVTSASVQSTSGRVSLSQVSKVGMIAHVAQPIPLQKLSLRACGLQTAPKYFHKMTQLKELDLSENEKLNDPNMTLFSLENLRVLKIIGCPFADNPSSSRNEWYDIAKLRRLEAIDFEVWMGTHNMNPYRTKIPIELCALPLKRINDITLRPRLFVDDAVMTVVNLLRDGYFKINCALDAPTIDSFLEAIKLFQDGEKFFFPESMSLRGQTLENTPPVNANGNEANSSVPGAQQPTTNLLEVDGALLGSLHLRITISRYIFFLAVQAANYDAVIIPPRDVMILHYSQFTICPTKYRADCEAISGRILDCNYHHFFYQKSEKSEAAKEAVMNSKNIWNVMVRSAQRNLQWLRYDFWDKRAVRGTGACDTGTASRSYLDGPGVGKQMLPFQPVGLTREEIQADLDELQNLDSTHDLCDALDSAITSHFIEQGTAGFASALQEFFRIGRCLTAHEVALQQVTLDWTRYVKYLALYAYRSRLQRCRNEPINVSDSEMDNRDGMYLPMYRKRSPFSILGPHYDAMINQSFTDTDAYLPRPASHDDVMSMIRNNNINGERDSRLESSGVIGQELKGSVNRQHSSIAVQVCESAPVPTLGIILMLFAHRTRHVKYFQILSLLGIENVDVMWEETPLAVEHTKKAWDAVYEEDYAGPGTLFLFEDRSTLVSADGAAVSSRARHAAPSSENTTPWMNVPALRSCLKRDKRRPNEGRVRICSGDTEFGVF